MTTCTYSNKCSEPKTEDSRISLHNLAFIEDLEDIQSSSKTNKITNNQITDKNQSTSDLESLADFDKKEMSKKLKSENRNHSQDETKVGTKSKNTIENCNYNAQYLEYIANMNKNFSFKMHLQNDNDDNGNNRINKVNINITNSYNIVNNNSHGKDHNNKTKNIKVINHIKNHNANNHKEKILIRYHTYPKEIDKVDDNVSKQIKIEKMIKAKSEKVHCACIVF